jgi:hypothetical protein
MSSASAVAGAIDAPTADATANRAIVRVDGNMGRLPFLAVLLRSTQDFTDGHFALGPEPRMFASE